MLNSLNPLFLTCIAIFFTSASYLCAGYLVRKRLMVWGSLAIGIVVVLTGYLMAGLHAPMWLIIAAPIPLGFLILWLQVKSLQTTSVIYAITWGFYLLFHVLLSSVAQFDSLLPFWRLHN